ncbi:MAG: zinc ribbon domain-containing protein [Candidatus Odinarchaeia archaeon]
MSNKFVRFLEDWPLGDDLSDTVLDFLIKYPKFPKERVIVFYDNFVLTNYRIYYKNEDGTPYLIPHEYIREYIIRGNNQLIYKLRNKKVIELSGPVPKFEILKKTYKAKEWKKMAKDLRKLLDKTNAELGRPVREKPKKEIIVESAETKQLLIPKTTNGIYCPHCGFKITIEGARFCPNCGVDLI